MTEDWLCNYTTPFLFYLQVTVLLKPLSRSPSPLRALHLLLSSKLPVIWWVEAERLPSNLLVLVQVSQSVSPSAHHMLVSLSAHLNVPLLRSINFFPLKWYSLPSSARYPQTPACSPAPCICTSKRCIRYLFVHVRCTAGLWNTTATCPLWHTHHTAIESTSHWERVSHQETKYHIDDKSYSTIMPSMICCI